jgi:hypothetical protein
VKLLALVLLIAVPTWAQEPRTLDVRRATVTLQDGRTVEVVEGCWLSTQQCVSTGKELAQLRAENASLKKDAGRPPLAAVLIAFTLGAAAGGFALHRLTR